MPLATQKNQYGEREEAESRGRITRQNHENQEAESRTNDKKVQVLKDDCRLFSQLFIYCQSRECDLQEFFKHENQSFPAASWFCLVILPLDSASSLSPYWFFLSGQRHFLWEWALQSMRAKSHPCITTWKIISLYAPRRWQPSWKKGRHLGFFSGQWLFP